jgi:hypothetical protein
VCSATTALPPNSYAATSPWGVVSEPNPAHVEPVDEAFITAIRTRMQELLALDAQVGGNETSAQALRLFRSVHRHIGVSPCPKRLQRELYAAVGELAEIAGWLCYDADQQDVMRRINQEALYYLRWAGHRSLELLTLQNMSMQAEYLNRPSEALHIVQSVLEADRLSPRMESLFLARGAHALAQQHQEAEAVRTFQKAQARYLDGPRNNEPAWAYWVDERSKASSMSVTGGKLNSSCRSSLRTSVRWAQGGRRASSGKRCTPYGKLIPPQPWRTGWCGCAGCWRGCISNQGLDACWRQAVADLPGSGSWTIRRGQPRHPRLTAPRPDVGGKGAIR